MRDIAIERDDSGRAVRVWFGRESTEGAPVASGSVATLRSGIPCDFCGGEIPLSRRRGSERRFCSDKCRRDSWDKAHPRLDFDRPDRVTPAPATGEPYESARVWLLGRLQVGPASTLELRCPPWRASQNPAQRVLELRNRQHDIRTVRLGRRTWYWLHIDGLPLGTVPEGE